MDHIYEMVKGIQQCVYLSFSRSSYDSFRPRRYHSRLEDNEHEYDSPA